MLSIIPPCLLIPDRQTKYLRLLLIPNLKDDKVYIACDTSIAFSAKMKIQVEWLLLRIAMNLKMVADRQQTQQKMPET